MTIDLRADETEHPTASIEEFTLPPDTSMPHTLPTGQKAVRVAKWRWLDSEWKPVVKPNETDAEGWIYTDNAWKNPGPSEAFGKYTVFLLIDETEKLAAPEVYTHVGVERRDSFHGLYWF